MKLVLLLALTITSFGVFAQSNSEIRAGIESLDYVSLRENFETLSSAKAFGLSVGYDLGMESGKLNVGPVAGLRIAPTAPISGYATISRNLILGETNQEFGAEIKINNDSRLGIGKMYSDSGTSRVVVKYKVFAGGSRQ